MHPHYYVYVISALGFLHWFGDFFLQSNYMGINKSKSNLVLSVHCIIYALVLALGTTGLEYYRCKDPTIELSLWALFFGMILSLYFVTHFLTDFVTSRITSYLWTNEKVHWFFVVIGFDQWLHLVTILAIAHWVVLI